MFNNLLTLLSLVGFLQSPAVWSDPWHAALSVGGGAAIATHLGQSKSFPIIYPLSDQFFSYTPTQTTQTKEMFEVFIGGEHAFHTKWIAQLGLAYTRSGTWSSAGDLSQGIDLQTADFYSYRYNVMTQQLLAQSKWIYRYNEQWLPFVLLGIGGAMNQASNYATTVPPFLTFTQMYQNHTKNTWSYRVGVGSDYALSSHARLGVAYRLSDLGAVSLGTGHINGIPISGTLSQSNVYVHEVLVQMTYVI